MNCYEFRDYISGYIEKELSLSDVKKFDHHFRLCPACKDAYKGVVSVINALRDLDRVALSDSFNAILQSRLKRISSKPARRISRYFEDGRILGFEPRYAVASIAAVVLIIVLSVGLFPEKKGTSTVNPIPLSTQQQVREPAGVSEMDIPSTPSPTYLADDSKDDSTDSKSDVHKSTPSYKGKIKLVKDRQ